MQWSADTFNAPSISLGPGSMSGANWEPTTATGTACTAPLTFDDIEQSIGEYTDTKSVKCPVQPALQN